MFNHENKLGEKGFIEMNEEIRDIHIERRLSNRNRRELEGKREKYTKSRMIDFQRHMIMFIRNKGVRRRE